MPPPGHEPFLRAICESPEDDTVRLVYADWLDENGDAERAEFIRVSIEFERLGKHAATDAALMARYRSVCQQLEHWKAELPQLPGINWPGAFRRGFPYQVDTSDGRWLVRQADAVFSSAPIEQLSVSNAGLGTLAKVLELRELSRITTLWLHNCRLTPGQWSVVGECPHLRRVTHLGLAIPTQARGGIPDPIFTLDDATALAGSLVLPRELELRLSGWISDEVKEILCGRFATVKSHRPPRVGPPDNPPA